MQAVFLDIETTGLDPLKSKIIDIAFFVIDLTAQKKRLSYQSVIKQSQEVWNERDERSTEFNGFTFDDVARGKPLETVVSDIKEIFTQHKIKRGSAFFICQNPAFDRTFFSQLIPIPIQEELEMPYHWLDLASMYFALTLKDCLNKGLPFPENMSLSKNSIAEKFNIPEEAHPHKALGGVNHLIQCYEALFKVTFEQESS